MVRCQRQELDELASLAQTPGRGGDRLAATRRGEPAEERDRDVPRRMRVIIELGLQASAPQSSLRDLRCSTLRASANAPAGRRTRISRIRGRPTPTRHEANTT